MESLEVNGRLVQLFCSTKVGMMKSTMEKERAVMRFFRRVLFGKSMVNAL